MSEQQIRVTFAEFANAWNAHDPAAMAALWNDDGTVVDLWGRFVAGRNAIAEFLTSEHEGSMRESAYRVMDVRVQSLSGTTAIVECDAIIDDVLAPNGKPYELRHQLHGVLVANGDGRWRFATIHPSFRPAG